MELLNLTLDIGNSFVKLGSFVGSKLVESKRFPLDALQELVDYLQRSDIEALALCKVRQIPTPLQALLAKSTFPCLEVDTLTPNAPIICAYEKPEELGSDRWVAAVAAWKQHSHRPLLVVDIGTCLTIDFVSAEGRFEGGIISPGVAMRLLAMHQHTGALPEVTLDGAIDLLPRNSQTAMRTGVMRGMKYEIEGWAQHYAAHYPHLMVVLTGGGFDDLHLEIDCEHSYDAQLVLRGLNTFIQ